MKKILIISALALAAASCSPLRLVMNSVDNSGVRTVLTSDKNLTGSFKASVDMAMAGRVEKKDTVLAILLTVDADSRHGIFSKGDQMKFRLGDDSVIELTNLYDKEFEEKQETYVGSTTRTDFRYAYAYDYWTDSVWVTPYVVNQMVPDVHTTRKSLSYALYLITKGQINDIIGKGVKKIRVEIENGEIDMTDTDFVPGLFKEMYAMVLEGLNTTYTRPEF